MTVAAGASTDLWQRPAELLQRLIRFDTTNPPGNERECIGFIEGLLGEAGIGSGIWHGFRNRDALFWEVQSGLFFLFAVVFFWARRLWSYLGAALFLALFFGGFSLSREYWDRAFFGIPVQRWVALAPVVILAGIALIAQTYIYSKR